MNKQINISWCVTVCNELMEIQRLVSFLLQTIKNDDEIIIQYDMQSVTNDVLDYITLIDKSHSNCMIAGFPLNDDFSTFKNNLSKLATKSYIVQLDADELPHAILMENIHDILELNDIDVIVVPRVNTVEGLTDEHIQKWGWQVNENGWVNWPDYQFRIYRNSINIKWVNKVHETLDGYATISNLPLDASMALFHPKTIERQEKQNEFYETL
jgi:hypothetical protein